MLNLYNAGAYPGAHYQIALIDAAGQQSRQLFRCVGVCEGRLRQLNPDPIDQVEGRSERSFSFVHRTENVSATLGGPDRKRNLGLPFTGGHDRFTPMYRRHPKQRRDVVSCKEHEVARGDYHQPGFGPQQSSSQAWQRPLSRSEVSDGRDVELRTSGPADGCNRVRSPAP